MKTIVCVRTRDEEHRIRQFCESYKDADKILVADGGSNDRTIEYASQFPNVEIRNYTKRVQLANGLWRNNDSDHTNFLIEWAYSQQPDWVIFDDCDIRPNKGLRENYIELLENFLCQGVETVLAVRVYLWGTDQYFPQLSSPLGEALGQGSLWAWRGNLDLWTVDVPPAFTFRVGSKPVTEFRTDTKCVSVLFPYCLLHYSWDNPDRVNRKVQYYRESGFIPNMLHPLDFGGKLEPLKDFMYE